MRASRRLNIAVVGSGISGLSAAWLLARSHDVTVYEGAARLGGHTHTVAVATGQGAVTVDTGFIVYNPPAYPNLCALFSHLGVATRPSDMSFAVSLGNGALEYSGTDLNGLFAQRRNAVSPRFWSMLRDIRRFYGTAAGHVAALEPTVTLRAFLDAHRYGMPFRDDHLLPMAAAIWSAPAAKILDFPARTFITFFQNHGLLELTRRPIWRTVVGGSAAYIPKLTEPFADRIRLGCAVTSVRREDGAILIGDSGGGSQRFDHVVLACHADEALAMLKDGDDHERRLLGSFAYSHNDTVLHSDPQLMPKRRAVWSSWNYAGTRDELCVTYWMNRLQGLPEAQPYFVTLNPITEPDPALVHKRISYAHPIFTPAALTAQRSLWSLQGVRNTWFCGAYFGSGFHEDGLQAGLAVAEQLGGTPRPWTVPNPSSRITVSSRPLSRAAYAEAMA